MIKMEIINLTKELNNLNYEAKCYCKDFGMAKSEFVLNNDRAELIFENENGDTIGTVTSTNFVTKKEFSFLKTMFFSQVRIEIIQSLLMNIDELIFKGGE